MKFLSPTMGRPSPRNSRGFTLLETVLALALVLPLLLGARKISAHFQRQMALQEMQAAFPQLCRATKIFCRTNESLFSGNTSVILSWQCDGNGNFSVRPVSSGAPPENYLQLTPAEGDLVFHCSCHMGNFVRTFLLSAADAAPVFP